jgi:hypothetical protein
MSFDDLKFLNLLHQSTKDEPKKPFKRKTEPQCMLTDLQRELFSSPLPEGGELLESTMKLRLAQRQKQPFPFLEKTLVMQLDVQF